MTNRWSLNRCAGSFGLYPIGRAYLASARDWCRQSREAMTIESQMSAATEEAMMCMEDFDVQVSDKRSCFKAECRGSTCIGKASA